MTPGTPQDGQSEDDAIHMKRSRWSRKTLCGDRVKDKLNVVVQGHIWPDRWQGCWTCLERAGFHPEVGRRR